MFINVYCDESRHLEHDNSKAMAIGGIMLPAEKVRSVSSAIRNIKEIYNLDENFEIKWTRVTNNREQLYLDLIDYFVSVPYLGLRAIIIPDKSIIDHVLFNQDHDTWYYKIYYEMLYPIFKTPNQYNVYIDIKDTKGSVKVTKLHRILCHKNKDTDATLINKIQTIRSSETPILQLADFLVGAVAYRNSGIFNNNAKHRIVKYLETKIQASLDETTSLSETKVNLLKWRPKDGK